MGEVYRAIDTRLKRTVAIKVLREDAADNPIRLERFEREAHAISSLNHPHICTVYDSGHQNGLRYLVMEHCDGETLADRLARRSMRLDEAIRCATEIATALSAAHQKGIVHRDLKPGNIMLTSTGAKVLDFGLAKLTDAASPNPPSLSTLSGDGDGLTSEGAILGTLNYMSPEQLEGKPVDARADLFAFGAVLYEMVGGRRAFEGASRASVIAAILEREPPPIRSARPQISPALERVLHKCLAKEPERRWQTARDLADELQWIASADPQIGSAGGRSKTVGNRAAWIGAGSLIMLTAVVLVALAPGNIWRAGTPVTVGTEFVIPAPPDTTYGDTPFSISPDGRLLAFIATPPNGKNALWVRPLNSLDAQRLPGTDDATLPFWSPDSRFLGFFAGGKLKKVAVPGGTPQDLTDAVRPHGGSWSKDDVIIFSQQIDGRIRRIRAGGGDVTTVTQLDASRSEVVHSWPQFLPDGQHFIFRIWSPVPDVTGLYVGSLAAGRSHRLLNANSNAVYVQTGHLLFHRGGTVYAQRFDLEKLLLADEPHRIADQLVFNEVSAHAAFTASDNGTLGFRPAPRTQLLWFDRAGQRLGSVAEAAYYLDPALSNDDRRLAVARVDPSTQTPDIWLIDLKTGSRTRMTFDAASDRSPVWTADSRRIAFSSNRELNYNIYQASVEHGGREEVLFRSPYNKWPTDWSSDDRFMAFHEAIGATRRSGLRLLALTDDRKPHHFTDSVGDGATFSPDARWVAFTTGDVQVKAVPPAEGEWRISTGGGVEPVWRRDGRELFYLSGDDVLMAVTIRTSDGKFNYEAARPLFKTMVPRARGTARNHYAVTSDGQRFLINAAVGDTSVPPITIRTDWTAILSGR